MKKRVLIITDSFPPNFAPRIGCLCRNIGMLNWTAEVVTEAYDSFSDFDLDVGETIVHRYDYNCSSRPFAFLRWGIKYLLTIFFNYKEHWLYKKTRDDLNSISFDLVLVSAPRDFPLLTAYKISKERRIPLVVDLRDVAEQYVATAGRSHEFGRVGGFVKIVATMVRKIEIMRRNRVLRKASAVISVSPWHCEFLRQYNKNVHLIYNGYDEKLFYPRNVKTEQFIITYAGRILDLTVQNPFLFFAAVAHLLKEGVVEEKKILIRWYVDVSTVSILTPYVEQYGLGDITSFHSFVCASKVPDLFRESSVCLVLTNKLDTKDSPKGIMTTKFFEILGVEKPILCVKSDEDCLADAIRQTTVGISATIVDEVESFLVEKYEEWKINGFTVMNVDKEKKKEFSRQSQAQQFIEVFNEVLKL